MATPFISPYVEGSTYTFYGSVTMETIICYKCNIPFAVPQGLKKYLQNSKDDFYCPHGHSQAYVESTLERERKKHQRELEEKDRIAARLRSDLSNADYVKNNLEKDLKKERLKLKRVHNGVCPCCNRFFSNLSKHMETKHPEKKLKKK